MIYFELNGDYAEASYIDEQLAKQVTFLTKEEYEEGLDRKLRELLLEIRPEEEQ